MQVKLDLLIFSLIFEKEILSLASQESQIYCARSHCYKNNALF